MKQRLILGEGDNASLIQSKSFPVYNYSKDLRTPIFTMGDNSKYINEYAMHSKRRQQRRDGSGSKGMVSH